MKSASNDDRKESAKAMLEKKRARLQELLEQVAEGARLESGTYPTSMAALRAWVDNSNGLEKIGSPRITNRQLKPEHSTILDEIDELFKRLLAYESTQRKAQKKRPSRQQQLNKVTAERDDAIYLVSRLLSEVQVLLHQVHTLRHAAKSAEDSRVRTSATVKSLAKQVVQLGGSTVKRIK